MPYVMGDADRCGHFVCSKLAYAPLRLRSHICNNRKLENLTKRKTYVGQRYLIMSVKERFDNNEYCKQGT